MYDSIYLEDYCAEDLYCNQNYEHFIPDPLFYYDEITIKNIMAETEKSLLLDIEYFGIYWIPKKILKRDAKTKTDYIHSAIFAEILKRGGL